MRQTALFLCSPQKNGATDRLADFFRENLEARGIPCRVIALRDFAIKPCAGCNACFAPPFRCILASQDQVEELLGLLRESNLAVFFSPIYFYALPAHFKAFIDRGQRFWGALNAGQRPQIIHSTAVLAAGRPRGARLFSGALLTLRCFSKVVGLKFGNPLVFYGLEKPEDTQKRPDVKAAIRDAAEHWIKKLASGSESD